jgi:hypothetical protein
MRVSFKGSHQYQFLCFGGREKWEESKRCAQEINNSQKAVTWRRKPPTGYYFPAPRSSTFVSELTSIFLLICSQHQIADGRRFPAVFHISISTCIKNACTRY